MMTIAEQYYVYHREEMIQADPALFSFERFCGQELFQAGLSCDKRGTSGVFTTARTYSNYGAAQGERLVFSLEHHIARLRRDASALGLLGSSTLHRGDSIARRTAKALLEHAHHFPSVDAQRFRILIRHPAYLEVWVEALTEKHQTLTAQRLQPLPVLRDNPQHKTTKISASREARVTAQENGFDDALLLGLNDEVLEAAWSNFFWFDREGKLHTAANNVLPGVVRHLILEQHTVRIGVRRLKDVLERASEAFISNSVIGIVPVRGIGQLELPKTRGKGTQAMLAWYHELIRREARPLTSYLR